MCSFIDNTDLINIISGWIGELREANQINLKDDGERSILEGILRFYLSNMEE